MYVLFHACALFVIFMYAILCHVNIEYVKEDKLMLYLNRRHRHCRYACMSNGLLCLCADCASRRQIEHVTCSVYKEALETIPAMVRQWWKDQDRKTAAYIDK